MVKQTIQIYLRLRPSGCQKQISKYNIDDTDYNHHHQQQRQQQQQQQQQPKKPRISFECAKDIQQDGVICNRKELHNFKFDAIFDTKCGQDQVFNHVAKPVIEKALLGYNGTIFAYGQTGSGKTYTITGGAEKYSERGIIPRCIAYLFDHFEKDTSSEFTLKISYMEIYNEIGYDLLDARHHIASKLEDLPRVTLFEHTDAGTVHLKNLSIHSASNTDEALNLLFMGDTNRIIAETPMNEASTRSHCIFTMHITSQTHGSSVIRRSKLHLVDLAGSERVYKCGLDGTLLTEAKYINLSLHYLEQVIIALAEKQRTHVPYRNSMMTMMLRDSLGGNCMTSMIATCSIEQENLQETLSTCRFAQRVALIKNEITLNEEQDPYLTINHLKSEIEHLKAELALATGIEKDASLTSEDKERCEQLIKEFLTTPQTNSEYVIVPTPILSNVHMINLAFSLIHEFYWKNIQKLKAAEKSTKHVVVPPLPNTTKEANQLREILSQRDHEIRVLVNLLRQEKQKKIPEVYSAEAYCDLTDGNQPNNGNNNNNKDDDGDKSINRVNETWTAQIQNGTKDANISGWDRNNTSTQKKLFEESKRAVDHVTEWLEQQAKGKLLGHLSMGREEAFDMFKQDYPLQGQINKQKEELKSLYAEAKLQGVKMSKAKEEAGNIRVQLNTIIQNNNNDCRTQETLTELRNQLEVRRTEYRDSYNSLKELKPRVEHLQHSLELAKMRLVQDFESWWNKISCEVGEDTTSNCLHNGSVTSHRSGHVENQKMNLKTATDQNSSESINHSNMGLKSESPCEVSQTNKQVNNTMEHRTIISQSIPLTGDPVVDADILTFIRAREKIRSRRLLAEQQQRRSQCTE
ncbi:unnamed protein product [Trichobilharzia szidati]|nr:unnamed protein product [Trichobilharzia szidati]